jgi:hypothetical protein
MYAQHCPFVQESLQFNTAILAFTQTFKAHVLARKQADGCWAGCIHLEVSGMHNVSKFCVASAQPGQPS